MTRLDIRCSMALANVIAVFDIDTAERLSGKAMDAAYHEGFTNYRTGVYLVPTIFNGEPLLESHWNDGQLDAQEASEIGRFDVHESIKSAQKEAAVGCGLSDVLYEANLQSLFSAILHASPVEERVSTAAALKAAGYDPEYKPYQPLKGECSLTGIDTDCCPCGLHP